MYPPEPREWILSHLKALKALHHVNGLNVLEWIFNPFNRHVLQCWQLARVYDG